MIPFRFHIAIVLALLTAVPMSRYPENQKVRKPAVAGSFYPASAQEIISGAIPGNQRIKSGKGLPDRFIVLRIFHEGAAASKIYFYHIHSINFLAFAKVLFFAVKSYILFIFVNYE